MQTDFVTVAKDVFLNIWKILGSVMRSVFSRTDLKLHFQKAET